LQKSIYLAVAEINPSIIMTTILVPTDFTDVSRNASIYATEFAKALHGRILLFHAYHIPVVPTADAPIPAVPDVRELENDNMHLLKKEASYLSTLSGVQIDCISTEGFAVDEILIIEEKHRPDLIIMGITTAGSLAEFVFGSIATDVISKTHTPVIVIPENAKYKKIERIVFSSDYKLEADSNELAMLKHIIKNFNAKLYILNVEKEKEDIEVDKALLMMKIENYFDDIEHTHHLPIDNDLIHGLNTFIEVHEIDLIAMIPNKHNLLTRMFHESSTKKMAFHTHIPLLTLHPAHSKD
jgi:nucleotide-binding universal stress UspA family protein